MARGLSGVSDASALQADLGAVYQWAEDNNMSFNDLKFEVLRFGSDLTLKLITSYTNPSGNIIDSKEHVRDLGVTVSADGSFREHIRKVCQSARNMCAWIFVHSQIVGKISCSQHGKVWSSPSWTTVHSSGALKTKEISK